MSSKKDKSEKIVGELTEVEIVQAQGSATVETCHIDDDGFHSLLGYRRSAK